MDPDRQLLTQFLQSGSQSIFAQIVDRHAAMVYAVARRTVDDAHLAEDVTQAVFLLLTRKAATLGPSVVLAGWLFHVARLVGADANKKRRRQLRRETEFAMSTARSGAMSGAMSAAMSTAASVKSTEDSLDWHTISPILDRAIGRLNHLDRDAVVLRFLQAKSHAEIGVALGVTEDAAKMRVSRALRKLRGHLEAAGVRTSDAGLAATLPLKTQLPLPPGVITKLTLNKLSGSTAVRTLADDAIHRWFLTKTLLVSLPALLVLLATMMMIVHWQRSPLISARATTLPAPSSVASQAMPLSSEPMLPSPGDALQIRLGEMGTVWVAGIAAVSDPRTMWAADGEPLSGSWPLRDDLSRFAANTNAPANQPRYAVLLQFETTQAVHPAFPAGDEIISQSDTIIGGIHSQSMGIVYSPQQQPNRSQFFFRIAIGSFLPLLAPSKNSNDNDGIEVTGSTAAGNYTVAKPTVDGDHLVVPMTTTIHGYELQLAATVNLNGRLQEIIGVPLNSGVLVDPPRMNFAFPPGLHVGDITAIALQWRPRMGVFFDNLALVPGRRTSLQGLARPLTKTMSDGSHTVAVGGAVRSPGVYTIKPTMQTVSQLLDAIAPVNTPATRVGLRHRGDEPGDGGLELVFDEPLDLIKPSSEFNRVLEPSDELWVYAKRSSSASRNVDP